MRAIARLTPAMFMALYQQRYEMQPTTPASAKHPTPGLENARASRPGMSQPGADALKCHRASGTMIPA